MNILDLLDAKQHTHGFHDGLHQLGWFGEHTDLRDVVLVKCVQSLSKANHIMSFVFVNCIEI